MQCIVYWGAQRPGSRGPNYLAPALAEDTSVRATSDHNMTSPENSEISSGPTLKIHTV